MKVKSTQPILDLKEPIKSTDFVSLQEIKNQRKTVGLKLIDGKQDMPTMDQQGSVQKAMEKAAKQNVDLTPHDWEWLKQAYKQAVLLDEMNRRATRKELLKEINVSDEKLARTLTELKIKQQIASEVADTRELRRVLKNRAIKSEQIWHEWLQKIDRKTIANNRKLLETLLHSIGFKLGFIPLASNQEHLTKIQESFTSIITKQQDKDRIIELLLEHKIGSAELSEKTRVDIQNTRRFLDAEMEMILDKKAQQRVNSQIAHEKLLELFLSRLGFKKGFIPLASNQKHLTEVKESLSKTALKEEAIAHNIETQEREAFDFKVTEDERKANIKSMDIVENKKELVHAEQLLKLLLQSWGFKLGYIRLSENQEHLTTVGKTVTQVKSELLEVEQEVDQSEKQNLDDFRQELERMSRNTVLAEAKASIEKKIGESKEFRSDTRAEESHDKKRALLLAMGFKPGFIPTPAKALELSLKEEDLARLKVEKQPSTEKQEDAQYLELAQMQTAAQLAQYQTTSSDIKNRDDKQAFEQQPLQKIKAAK